MKSPQGHPVKKYQVMYRYSLCNKSTGMIVPMIGFDAVIAMDVEHVREIITHRHTSCHILSIVEDKKPTMWELFLVSVRELFGGSVDTTGKITQSNIKGQIKELIKQKKFIKWSDAHSGLGFGSKFQRCNVSIIVNIFESAVPGASALLVDDFGYHTKSVGMFHRLWLKENGFPFLPKMH